MSAYHKNALPRGYKLSEYIVESVLGHGGFGVTYLARDEALGALVAIKEYMPHELAARDNDRTQIIPNLENRRAVQDYHWGLKRFLQEAQALARFKHPNIVRVLRYMEANGTAYMVMEYEKGQSLGQYLKQHGNRLSEPDIMRVYLPVLNGLEAVHRAGMLHLDIKPDNIYLREDGSPMLIDFGSARQALTGHGGNQRVVLTPGYAPIEQYPDKGEQGPWTDIYATGASLYRCMTGKRPKDALERYQIMLRMQLDSLTPATKLAEGRFPTRLLECVDWAMQIYPKDRPQSARILQDALIGKENPPRKQTLAIRIDKPKEEKLPRIFIGDIVRVVAKSVGVLVVLGALSGAAGYYFWPDLVKQYPQLQRWFDRSGLEKTIPADWRRKLRSLRLREQLSYQRRF